MPGRVEGKVAFVTGAARGQGRSHAIKLAEEGADIIAIDVCKNVDNVQLDLATPGDLLETKARVEALGRRIIAEEVDVRDYDAMKAVVDRGSPNSAGSTSSWPMPVSATVARRSRRSKRTSGRP